MLEHDESVRTVPLLDASGIGSVFVGYVDDKLAGAQRLQIGDPGIMQILVRDVTVRPFVALVNLTKWEDGRDNFYIYARLPLDQGPKP